MKHINKRKGFPTFATIVLAVGVLWLLNSLGFIKGDIPWWPIVVIIVAFGWIISFYNK
jgi:hypothetical protein